MPCSAWLAYALFTPQISIRVTSEKYRPVANRSSLLFFLMNDLVKVHSYYIYSLAAFTKVCVQHTSRKPMVSFPMFLSPIDYCRHEKEKPSLEQHLKHSGRAAILLLLVEHFLEPDTV